MHLKSLLFTLALIACSILFASVNASGRPVRPSMSVWRATKFPELDRLNLDIMVAFERVKFYMNNPTYDADGNLLTPTTHNLIKAARLEMFEKYDQFLAEKCRLLDDKSQKESLLFHATKALEDGLYRVSMLDYHNGCLAPSTGFPSITYGRRNRA